MPIRNFLKKEYGRITILLMITAIMCFAVSASGAEQVYNNKKERVLPIYCVDRSDKVISITFDCAWGADYTLTLLDLFDEYNVKTTFFATQFWTEKYPDMAKKISEKGHELGTHSRTHSYMSKMSREEIESELKTSSEAIEKITGKGVSLFRAPFGDYDDLLIQTAKDMGMYSIQWDVDSLDWKGLSAQELSYRIIQRTKNGSIILCHNNSDHIHEALPLIFSDLIGKGYKFVTVSDLIYKENYYIDNNGKQTPSK